MVQTNETAPRRRLTAQDTVNEHIRNAQRTHEATARGYRRAQIGAGVGTLTATAVLTWAEHRGLVGDRTVNIALVAGTAVTLFLGRGADAADRAAESSPDIINHLRIVNGQEPLDPPELRLVLGGGQGEQLGGRPAFLDGA